MRFHPSLPKIAENRPPSSVPNLARLVALLLLVLMCGHAAAFAQTHGTYELVSATVPDPSSTNRNSNGQNITPDGRFVVFSSRASNIVPNDDDGFSEDVFVTDMMTGATVLVSVNTAGNSSGAGNAYSPVISADGRFVAFVSDAANLTPLSNFVTNVYVRDLQTATTMLVSVNSAGTGAGNDDSFSPAITPDGRYVVFVSDAGNLIGDNLSTQLAAVYRRDLQTETTALVSVNNAGTGVGNGGSFSPVVSADGRFVAFDSSASNLVANDSNGPAFDVFRRDMTAGTTALVSANSVGTDTGNGSSFTPVMTPDGRFVAFDSSASNLVVNDSNGNESDVFVRDLQTGTTRLVSANSAGTGSGNSLSFSPSLSDDGNRVAFMSYASNLVADGTDFQFLNVFVRDLTTTTTALVSVSNAGAFNGDDFSYDAEISGNGNYVFFSSYASNLVANDSNGHMSDVFRRDLTANTTALVSVNAAGTGSGNGYSTSPVATPDGRFVAFISLANDLVANDNGGTFDIFRRDMTAGTTAQVSRKDASVVGVKESGNDISYEPSISADGRFVAFTSSASDLATGDVNNTSDAFVRDMQTDTTVLASINRAGTGTGNSSSFSPVISPDGRFVVFTSYADDLAAVADANLTSDVFVRDLQTGTTTLVSVTNTGTGSGNNGSFAPSMSDNGRFVAFESFATDLTVDPKSNIGDVFVRDLQTGTTRLASINRDGTGGGNNGAFEPEISADGRRVVFLSFSGDLVANDFNFNTDVFVRDLSTNTTALVSINSAGTDSASGFSNSPAITPDGRFVAFTSNAFNIVASDPNGSTMDVFVRDLSTNTTMLVSVDSGNRPSSSPAISADGRYVLFARARNAVGNSGIGTQDVFRRDLLAGTTRQLNAPTQCAGIDNCVDLAFSLQLSADGRYAAFVREGRSATTLPPTSFRQALLISDIQSGTSNEVTSESFVNQGLIIGPFFSFSAPSLSDDGRHLAFSGLTRHTANDTNDVPDVFRYTALVQPGQFEFSLANSDADEDDGLVNIDVKRTGAFGDSTASVNYSTSDGTATAGADYTSASGTLTFAAGQTGNSFNVSITNDLLIEGDETVNLALSNPTGGATLGALNTARLRIHDDEMSPRLAINDVTVAEGDNGTTPAVFTVTLSTASAATVMVRYDAVSDTATQGIDFETTGGTLVFNPGETSKTITVPVIGDTVSEPNERFFVRLRNPDRATIMRAEGSGTITSDDPPSVRFTENNYFAPESDGRVEIAVMRFSDASVPFSVNYATENVTASERSDYIAARGRLDFAPGEITKTFTILLNDDVFVEDHEFVELTLSNPTNGASLGSPSTATLLIISTDMAQPTTNPLDNSRFFVEQQYRDFLNRVPDAAGRDFWTNQLDTLIAACNNQPAGDARRACVLGARAQVSAAFFLSIEFQQTGYFVIRLYQESYGQLPARPTLREFLADTQEVGRGVIVGQPGAEQRLEANRQKFADDWVNRAEFRMRYDAMSNADYVNALFANAGVAAGDEQPLRASLIAGLNDASETRATVLRKVADSRGVSNKVYNPALVLMQYYGYLRRRPNDAPDNSLAGYNFWLGKLDGFSLAGEDVRDADTALARIKRAQMVEAFINSGEYRGRLGP